MHPKKTQKSNRKIRVGISIGDYNGIGLEVIIKTFSDARMMDVCTPIVYGNLNLVNAYKKSLNASDDTRCNGATRRVYSRCCA